MLKEIYQILIGFLSILKGLGVTWKNIFRKPVTMEYPLDKPVMTAKHRGLVDLIPDKCIACLQCSKICPTAALVVSGIMNPETKKRAPDKFVYNTELCCFCGLCEEICPTSALFMNKCYEIACYQHADLTPIDLLRSNKYQHLTSPRTRERKK